MEVYRSYGYPNTLRMTPAMAMTKSKHNFTLLQNLVLVERVVLSIAACDYESRLWLLVHFLIITTCAPLVLLQWVEQPFYQIFFNPTGGTHHPFEKSRRIHVLG